jgi:hypothetical protein
MSHLIVVMNSVNGTFSWLYSVTVGLRCEEQDPCFNELYGE